MNKLKYYYNYLTPLEKKIYEGLEKGLTNRSDPIRVMGSGTQVKKIMPLVYLDNPQLFYVDNTQLSLMDGGLFCIVTPCYYKDQAQSRAISAYLQRIADRFLEEIRKKRLNNQMTVKYAHDFVIRNTEYARENLISGQAAGDVSTIVGVFCNHRAVCMGIAMAEKWLLDLAGIPSAIIEGYVDERGMARIPDYSGTAEQNNHAWNLVCVNDLWYHMDVTMDLGATPSGKPVAYDYFLRSDTVFRKCAQYICPAGISDEERSSYFASSHSILRDRRQMEQYIGECLRKKKKRIYFELQGNAVQLTQDQVRSYIGGAYPGGFSIRTNPRLHIYDIILQ